MATFGEGLGGLVGGMLGAHDLNNGQDAINATSSGFGARTEPYNTFGQSFLNPTSEAVGRVNDVAGTVKGYDQFMSDYKTSPAAQYAMDVADRGQEASAAAKGGLLSGSNQRALSSINQGIGTQYANTAYNEYLQGNNQQFGQLESALGNMFKAIGVGETATGQQAGVDTAQMGATSQIAQAQAKNDQGKGSGLGSMFSGLGSLAVAF